MTGTVNLTLIKCTNTRCQSSQSTGQWPEQFLVTTLLQISDDHEILWPQQQ